MTERADDLVATARETERLRLAPKPTPKFGNVGPLAGIAAQQSAMIANMGLLGEADKRSLDDYIAQVDGWKDRAIKEAPAVVLGRYIEAVHGVVAVTVTNPTGRFLTDVEVEVVFEGDHVGGFVEAPEVVELPPEPRRYGERTESPLLSRSMGFDASLLGVHPGQTFTPPPRRTHIDAKPGSVRIRFHIGDLRQHGTDTSADAFILVNGRPDGGILRGSWKATIRDQEGVVEGILETPLRSDPIELTELLQRQRHTEDSC